MTARQSDILARRSQRWFACLLLGLVFCLYFRTIYSAGFIWDDDNHITGNLTLRSLAGLLAIWFHPLSIPQYYPLVHTTFWMEFQLWRAWHPGFHFDNVLLHGISSVLLWRALRRLQIPGAALAALLFAVHPVQVESVAWVTERKNVLSLFFYLLSLHAYLNFAGNDLNRGAFRARPYLLALALFIFALLSKSVTCSLPAAIGLLIYWKHGRVRWGDLKPLIPFFALGIFMALVTSHLEKTRVGAAGDEWPWTFTQRCGIAGRALWFYAGKLLWPHPLIFIYPRWTAIDPSHHHWLIAFPLCAIGAIAGLYALRHRIGRGPLVAVLFYAGTLLPALGFVNIFPMRYSFVADHFQYHASIGLLTLAAVGIARARPPVSRAISVAAIAALSILSIRQQAIYQNAIALWTDTAARNPTGWIAYANLGDLHGIQGDDGRAAANYRKLRDLAPQLPEAHWRWGIVLEHQNDFAGARSEFENALKIQPRFEPAIVSLGVVCAQDNQLDKAIEYYQRALKINPNYAEAHYRLAAALEQQGDINSAIAQYSQAVALRPDLAEANYNLANLLLTEKNYPRAAIPLYAAAIAAQPRRADFRCNYAVALYAAGRITEAREQCRAALAIDPQLPQAIHLRDTIGGI